MQRHKTNTNRRIVAFVVSALFVFSAIVGILLFTSNGKGAKGILPREINIVTPEKSIISAGETIALSAEITNIDGATTRDSQQLLWLSDNNDVLSINQKTGVVTGLSKGRATVTATLGNGFEDSIDLFVDSSVPTADKPTIGIVWPVVDNGTLKVDETIKLDITIDGEVVDQEDAPIDIAWKSYSEGIAEIDEDNGNVSGIKAGEAIIKAYDINDESNYAETKITVVDAVDSSSASILANGSTVGSEGIVIRSGNVNVDDREVVLSVQFNGKKQPVQWAIANLNADKNGNFDNKNIRLEPKVDGTAILSASAPDDSKPGPYLVVMRTANIAPQSMYVTISDVAPTSFEIAGPSKIQVADGHGVWNTANYSVKSVKPSDAIKNVFWSVVGPQVNGIEIDRKTGLFRIDPSITEQTVTIRARSVVDSEIRADYKIELVEAELATGITIGNNTVIDIPAGDTYDFVANNKPTVQPVGALQFWSYHNGNVNNFDVDEVTGVITANKVSQGNELLVYTNNQFTDRFVFNITESEASIGGIRIKEYKEDETRAVSVGSTVALTAEVLGTDGKVLSGVEINWENNQNQATTITPNDDSQEREVVAGNSVNVVVDEELEVRIAAFVPNTKVKTWIHLNAIEGIIVNSITVSAPAIAPSEDDRDAGQNKDAIKVGTSREIEVVIDADTSETDDIKLFWTLNDGSGQDGIGPQYATFDNGNITWSNPGNPTIQISDKAPNSWWKNRTITVQAEAINNGGAKSEALSIEVEARPDLKFIEIEVVSDDAPYDEETDTVTMVADKNTVDFKAALYPVGAKATVEWDTTGMQYIAISDNGVLSRTSTGDAGEVDVAALVAGKDGLIDDHITAIVEESTAPDTSTTAIALQMQDGGKWVDAKARTMNQGAVRQYRAVDKILWDESQGKTVKIVSGASIYWRTTEKQAVDYVINEDGTITVTAVGKTLGEPVSLYAMLYANSFKDEVAITVEERESRLETFLNDTSMVDSLEFPGGLILADGPVRGFKVWLDMRAVELFENENTQDEEFVALKERVDALWANSIYSAEFKTVMNDARVTNIINGLSGDLTGYEIKGLIEDLTALLSDPIGSAFLLPFGQAAIQYVIDTVQEVFNANLDLGYVGNIQNNPSASLPELNDNGQLVFAENSEISGFEAYGNNLNINFELGENPLQATTNKVTFYVPFGGAKGWVTGVFVQVARQGNNIFARMMVDGRDTLEVSTPSANNGWKQVTDTEWYKSITVSKASGNNGALSANVGTQALTTDTQAFGGVTYISGLLTFGGVGFVGNTYTNVNVTVSKISLW